MYKDSIQHTWNNALSMAYRRSVLFLVTSLLFTSTLCAQNFSVSGTKLLDPAGAEFIPKGANIGLWNDDSNPTEVNKIKNLWKFNTVRVFLRLASGVGNYPTDEFMDKYVNAYTVNTNGPKVVVQFECHDFSGSYYTDASTPSLTDLRNFWKRAAARYKNNPYVWFNIMNEPGGTGPVAVTWRDLHNTVIADIRAAGAGNMIVVDGNGFASEDGNGTTKAAPIKTTTSGILTYGQAVLNADPQKRVTFSFHCYDAWRYSVDKMYDYVARVHALNLSVHIGEFAATTGSSAGDYPVTGSAENAITVARNRRIGALVWHYGDGDGNNLTTSPSKGTGGYNIDKTDGTRPTNLTYLGGLLWDFTHNTPEPNRGIPLNRYYWTATSSRASIGNPSLAVDGSVETALEISDPTASDWFKIDVGADRSFNRILIDTRKFGMSFMRDFKVYVSSSASSDGTLVATVTGNKASVSDVSFSTVTGRYVTIRPTLFGKSGYTYVSWAIADLQIFSSGTYTPPQITGTALNRTGWTATATKRSGWDAEWEAKALDNNYDTRFTTGAGATDGDHFTVDMKTPQTVQSVLLNVGSSGNNFARKIQIYVTNDLANLGTPAFEGIGSFVTKAVFAAPRTGRYIRIVNRTAFGDWWSIHEMFVYGPNGGTPELANGVYKITSKLSVGGTPLRCLDVDGAMDVNNRNVMLWQDNGNNAQRWYIQSTGDGYYKLVAQIGSRTRLLDAASPGRGNNVNVAIWVPGATDGAPNQRWKIEKMPDGYYKLTTKSSATDATKYCLDVAGGSNTNTANVQIYQDLNNDAQRWRIEPATLSTVATQSTAAARTSDAATEEQTPQTAALQVYPNPASSQVTLESPEEIVRVRVVNNIGLTGLEKAVSKLKRLQLETSRLKDGVYTVIVQTVSGNTISTKLQIRR